MPNVVYASNDALCQSAKDWFVRSGNAIEGPFDSMGDGNRLYIIAHDTDLGDGQGLVDFLRQQDFPMLQWDCVLIVCSAASPQLGSGLLTPAERLANFFQRRVYASRTIVYGQWSDQGGAQFLGDYMEVTPNTDLESLMARLQIN